jgi:putative transposase
MSVQTVRSTYRIYPTKEQVAHLNQDVGNQRFVWNYFLAKNIERYEAEKKFIFYMGPEGTGAALTKLKKEPEFDFLNRGNSQALQQTLITLDRALKGSFKTTKNKVRKGFPKFKKKHQGGTVAYPANCKIDESWFVVPKIKTGIKIKDSGRGFPEKFKTANIIKNPSGRWFVSMVHDIEIHEPKELTHESKSVGIDLNSRKLFQLSNGQYLENPKHLLAKEKRLKRYQRIMSRRVKDSKNRDKARIKVARIHEKVVNQRKDFLEKATTQICNTFDFIVIEDLNVKGMQKWNGRMIQSAPFGAVRQMLTWKTKKLGKTLQVISRFAPSSKTCNECGSIKDDLSLKDKKRLYVCHHCGHVDDRDMNAAKNILEMGTVEFLEKNITVGTAGRACGETKVHDVGNDIRWVSMKQETTWSLVKL